MATHTILAKADLQFAIDQMRKEKMVYALDALVVLFLSVLSAVFLPEMLFRIVFQNTTDQASLAILNWIPTVAYIVGAGVSLLVLGSNCVRCFKIKKLEAQLRQAKK